MLFMINIIICFLLNISNTKLEIMLTINNTKIRIIKPINIPFD